MTEPDWKTTQPGAAARSEVCGYFLNCLRLLDAGMEDEARRQLAPFRWRERLDLKGAPFTVVLQTERLCSAARLGEQEELRGNIHHILDLW